MPDSNTIPPRPEFDGLRACWSALDPAARELVSALLRDGQEHLFRDWDPPGIRDEEKRAFLDELLRINQHYPGGLCGYVTNARRLLAEARAGANPFEGYIPEQPACMDLARFDATYDRYEALAFEHFDRVGFVLVAGGLGERLGYSDIKLDIPVEVIEETSYLRYYASCLLAMEARMARPRPVPLIIMTSSATHAGTLALLEANAYFGLRKEQVNLVRQEPVPALCDNDGRLALEDRYRLVWKPHGHGDVHLLLHQSGLAARLRDDGIEHLVFIQDTNAQAFNALFAALGVSIEKGFDFNSLAVKRVPGEAAGALVRLVKDAAALTLNVEYNQLDALLRATVNPEGDAPDASGCSLFPGNINVLVIRLESYVRVLERTRGVIAEFVNPKYTDETKTRFKKPARLETLMQDLPKLFGPDETVGVTVFDRRWSFSANKNNLAEAAVRQAAGAPPECATTAEADFYRGGRMKLAAAGARCEEAPEIDIRGITFTPGPRVLLRPSFALSLAEVRERLVGVALAGQSTLIIEGQGVHIENLTLEGAAALVIKACAGARVRVQDLVVQNPGFALVPLTDEEMQDERIPEYLRIRGYRFEDRGARVYAFTKPGRYVIQSDGSVCEKT